jgi:hypothetical protein
VFDMVAVGGTGQCVLLELCFRRSRQPASPMPDRVWVVDRDYTGDWGNALRGLTAPLEWAASPEWVLPGGTNARANLDEVLKDDASGPRLVREVLTSGLTWAERHHSKERGFFAMPRLAASWVALKGFNTKPGFLDPDYLLTQGQGVPLVIVGSLAGGTGAGLLPLFTHLVRSGDCTRWKHPVWLLASLPWFNPGQTPNAPGWQDTCWNAADGVVELERVIRNIEAEIESSRPPNPQGIPLTGISLLGPTYDAEQEAPVAAEPILKAQSFGGSRVGAFVTLMADYLLALVQFQRPTPVAASRRRAVIGLAAMPEEVLGDAGTRSNLARNRFVAERLRALHLELRRKRAACRVPLFSVLSHGFGKVLGDMILARELPSSWAQPGNFWTAFDEALARRTSSLGTGADTWAVELARDVGETIRLLDEGWREGRQRLTDLLAQANSTSPEPSAREIAGEIVDRFLGDNERTQVDWLVASNRATGNVPFRPLITVPAHSGAGNTIDGNQTVLLFDGPLCANLAATLRPASVAFHGASWARLMGQAHKLRRFHEVDDSLAEDRPLGGSLLLWKAAVLGLVELAGYAVSAADRESAWFVAENFDRDFGSELVAARFEGEVVAFVSADLGFVPAAELIDESKRPEGENSCLRSYAILCRRVAERTALVGTNVQRVLEAFARRVSSGRHEDLAWHRIIWPATSSLAAADVDDRGRNVLAGCSFPSKRIYLRLSPGAAPSPVRLPLVLTPGEKRDLERVARTVGARGQFTREEGRLRWLGNDLAALESEDQRYYLLRTNGTAVSEAARAAGPAAPPPPDPLFAITW